MNRKPTEELNQLLSAVKPGQLEAWYEENRAYMAEGDRPFYHYMKDTIKEKGMRLMDVYSFAGYSESYGSKLLTMEKHTADRDAILRLCIAAHFSWVETNRALKLYGLSELYAREPRDVCIIVALNNRRYDLAEIDDLLETQGFPGLAKE